MARESWSLLPSFWVWLPLSSAYVQLFLGWSRVLSGWLSGYTISPQSQWGTWSVITLWPSYVSNYFPHFVINVEHACPLSLFIAFPLLLLRNTILLSRLIHCTANGLILVEEVGWRWAIGSHGVLRLTTLATANETYYRTTNGMWAQKKPQIFGVDGSLLMCAWSRVPSRLVWTTDPTARQDWLSKPLVQCLVYCWSQPPPATLKVA